MNNRKPIIAGMLGGLALLVVYFGIVSFANSFTHAIEEFGRIWYWIALLTAGFGIQVGLYFYIRQTLKERTRGATAEVMTAGGISTGSMIACCAHHITDVLPVLVLGETGTGKEELAKAIHHNGYRSEEPFVPVNCGSIPENLIESELFGHEKGAFTGADRRHIGSFEQANGGTVFLDEIAELPLHVQVKLLRVLQGHQIQRVGGEQIIDLDIRIIAATNQDLQEMVENGTFREDLFYRLNVVSITMPPLRNRNGDIDLLAEHFLNELSDGQQVCLSDEVYDLFHRYPFPGNVRELRNAIQRALVMNDGEKIQVDDLPSHIRNHQNETPGKQLDLHNMTLEEIERSAIMQALEQTGGNQTQAAKRLGIPRHVLIYRLKKYDIEV
ncbi:MAG: Regulatory protein AtoC [Candidatus Marinimicrobia bacterium]|nr:Regulatory protein AtoC [Candidatus Neomarinimicrobiota bacterium]